MMKRWKVKSKGKLERIIVVYLSMGLAGYGFLAATGLLRSDGLLPILAFSSIIWIPLVLVILKRILTSKIPIEISFDDALEICTIRYSKKICTEYPYDDLTYSIWNEGSMYCVLIFHETFIGTRGQTVFTEIVKIVGFKWSMSWKMKDVLDIVVQLSNNGVEETQSKKNGLSLWELLISR